MNINKNLSFKKVGLIFILIFIGKISGFSRDIFISYKFGASKATDAFFVANNIPSLFFASFIGSLLVFIIPKIEEIKSTGKSVNSFVISFISFIFLLSLFLTFIGFVYSDIIISLIAPGFDETTKESAINLSRILVWSFPFSSVSLLLAYISSTYGKLFSQHLIPVISNLFVIGGIIFFADIYGVKIIAISGVMAFAFQLVIQIVISKEYYKANLNFRFFNSDIKEIAILAIPFFLTNSIEQINAFVNTYIASEFVVGSVSHLNYAQKLQFTLNSSISLAIITISYPILSRLYYSSEKENFVLIFGQTIDFIIIALSLLTIILILYSSDIIKYIFLRGNFTIKDVKETSEIFFYYGLGVFSIAIREVLLRVYLIKKDSKTPLLISVLTIFINIILSVFLVPKFGIKSLAIANSFSVLINMFILFYFLPEARIIKVRTIFKHTIVPIILFVLFVFYFKYTFINVFGPIVGVFFMILMYLVLLLIFRNPFVLFVKRKFYE